jgi:hypothetical protein
MVWRNERMQGGDPWLAENFAANPKYVSQPAARVRGPTRTLTALAMLREAEVEKSNLTPFGHHCRYSKG